MSLSYNLKLIYEKSCCFFRNFRNGNAQKLIPVDNVEPVIINYNGIEVKAKKLTVHSVIPMRIDTAWNNVKSPAFLKFVAKGMMKFKSVGGPLPKQWEVGKTYGIKTRVFGLIPFGGIHYLFIKKLMIIILLSLLKNGIVERKFGITL